MQRHGSHILKGVGHGMETQLVMHVRNGILLEIGHLVDLHGGTLFLVFVITVITTHTRVRIVTLTLDPVWPVVEGLVQLAVKDLHEAVGAGMVMDGTGQTQHGGRFCRGEGRVGAAGNEKKKRGKEMVCRS